MQHTVALFFPTTEVTLQHTATTEVTLQHTAIRGATLLHSFPIATITLQHAATHCCTRSPQQAWHKALQHTVTHCNTPQYAAICCNTLLTPSPQ